MTERVVIYHAECDDGTAAAAVAQFACQKEPTLLFHPSHYVDPPPDVTGKIVDILDFCYPPDVLKEIAGKAVMVTVLDHHVSAMKACQGAFAMQTVVHNEQPVRPDRTCWYADEKLRILFDMDRSGAGMAWDSYMINRPRPIFIEYIQANDLWRLDALPQVKEVIRWIRSHPHSIDSYEDLMHRMADESVMQQAFIEGAGAERYFQQAVKNHINWSDVRIVKLKDVQGLCVAGPRHMISEIGQQLAESCASFGCVWYPRDGRAYVSLRSTEGGPDVSEIAKAYGGGGHKFAAGFEMDLFGFVMGVYTGEKV